MPFRHACSQKAFQTLPLAWETFGKTGRGQNEGPLILATSLAPASGKSVKSPSSFQHGFFLGR